MSGSLNHEVRVDSSEQESAQHGSQGPNRNLLKIAAGLIGLAVAAGLGYGVLAAVHRGRDVSSLQTATVRRGDLMVTVTAGGALQAMQSLQVRNEAEAPWPSSDYKRAITAIVEEGTVITEQDVEDGMVLVRFESSDLEEREAEGQVWFYMAEAGYARARENDAIQRGQNESDIAMAKLYVKFARMELDRYLGAELAAELVKEKSDFADLAEHSGLGGTAGQELAQDIAQVELATAELSRAEERLRWTRQLHDGKWISPTELTADELSVNRRRRELEAAKEELRLFKRYSLPKEAKQRYSDYEESLRHLARTEARARGRLAQTEANLKSSKASFELRQRELGGVRDSIEKCTIRAPKPGRVVYASTADPWRRTNDPVQEGQRLWPRQSIILIPDLSTLAARVTIHETDIEKVKLGQPALICVESMPDRQFAGTVARIGSVASLAQADVDPEIRVYEVDVALGQVCEGLTPGMSATAEILVAHLHDVLYLPIEALIAHDGRWACFVDGPKGSELRYIDIGQATENLVEVRQGLSEGEAVYLSLRMELPDEQAAHSVNEPIPTVAVARGDFTVSVTERGAVYSMEPLDVKSEVESWNALLEVVDEGTVITEKDVEEGMIVARLDSSPLEKQENGRQIALYGAEAAHVQAQENYGIQQRQNESDIAVAELNAEFAQMELEHYLGADLASQALKEEVDLADLADEPRLGGMARQEVRRYSSQVELATEELLRAQERLGWTEELYQKGYASRSELRADELAVATRTSELEAAKGELRLFARYALPRRVVQRHSDCVELARELERVEARASSRLAQAEAQLKSAEASLGLEREGIEKLRDKIEKCTMTAPRPGQVVYGSRSDPIWYRTGDMALRPGANIEENRTIVRIPDPSSLAALVNIPEENIQKVEVGQPVLITLEAVPDRTFAGRVAKVSPVASSAQAWINPEAKVYETEVALEEMPEHFIPGMSATVEIISAQLKDVLYVPAQAVAPYNGNSICWVQGADGPQPRVVQVGDRSDVFVEIESGLNAGERVYLAPPAQMAEESLPQIDVVASP